LSQRGAVLEEEEEEKDTMYLRYDDVSYLRRYDVS